MVWVLYLLILLKHRSNIYRLFHHQENKVGFKNKLKKVFCKQDGEETKNDENSSQNRDTENQAERENFDKIDVNNEKIDENIEKSDKNTENGDNKA